MLFHSVFLDVEPREELGGTIHTYIPMATNGRAQHMNAKEKQTLEHTLNGYCSKPRLQGDPRRGTHPSVLSLLVTQSFLGEVLRDELKTGMMISYD